MTEWIEVTSVCQRGPRYLPGRCLHGAADRVPVECVDGTTVAQLCTRCDAQLPADWPSHTYAPTVAELNAGFRPDPDIIEETYR